MSLISRACTEAINECQNWKEENDKTQKKYEDVCKEISAKIQAVTDAER